MKRRSPYILVSLICALCLAFTSACFGDDDGGSENGKHIHHYGSAWISDDGYHWHMCLNSGCDQKEGDKTAHTDADTDGECDVCGHEVEIAHVHNYKWKDNGDGTHKQHCNVYGCDNPDINEGEHEYNDGVCVCGVKEPKAEHQHDYKWIDNGDGTHKQHCDADGCDEPDINEGEHEYDEDGFCVCGAEDDGHVHDYRWVNNGDGTHKQHCDADGCDNPDINEGEHEYNEDGFCVCGEIVE